MSSIINPRDILRKTSILIIIIFVFFKLIAFEKLYFFAICEMRNKIYCSTSSLKQQIQNPVILLLHKVFHYKKPIKLRLRFIIAD